MSPKPNSSTGTNPITDNLHLWSSATKKKATVGRGKNGKTSPHGINKLRELILELAVRGKLVPQDPSDEPASVLLTKIAKEKARLVKEKAMRKTKVPTPFDEKPKYGLPAAWVWTTLYELGEIGPRNDLDDQLAAAFVPMQCISEKYGVAVDHETKQWKEIKSGFTHFQNGDVVLAKITPCFQNGKSAVMQGLENGLGAGTTELHVFGPVVDTLLPGFVLIYLKSPGFILEGIPKMTGTAGQKRITRDYFAGKDFPLPPLAEQHRIVAKVDELMALCDQLEQQQTDSLHAHQTLVRVFLDRMVGQANTSQPFHTELIDAFDTLFTTEESIDQLKQTILQLAVMGKLVPQNPNDEPASLLIRRVERFLCDEIKKNKLPQLKRDMSVYTPEDFQHEIPQNWKWTELQDIFIFINGKAHEQYVTEDGCYILVNSKFVSNSGTIKKHVNERLTPLKKGDVAIVMSDVPNGRALARCYVIESDDLYTLNQRIGGLTTSPELNRDYLMFALDRHPYMLAYNDGQKQTNLKKVQIMSAPVPIPPLAEQHRIVAKVDELMTLCDTLKARLNEAQTTQTQLADAVVEQAIQ